MECPPLAGAGDCRFTMRLQLQPVGPANAADLWLVHNDDAVWPWYDYEKPSLEQAEQAAKSMGDSWRCHGVHKWIAYDRVSGEVVGRGGLSRTPVDDDWGQIYAFLPDQPWVRVAHETHHPYIAHANWLEIGWALRHEYWGRGYAAEIGRAGLAFAFDVLGVQAVVSCTVPHNARSRAVMERIGMRYAGEIRSPGMVEGAEGEQDDAPFAVCVLLRTDWDRTGPCDSVTNEDDPAACWCRQAAVEANSIAPSTSSTNAHGLARDSASPNGDDPLPPAPAGSNWPIIALCNRSTCSPTSRSRAWTADRRRAFGSGSSTSRSR